MDRILLYSPPAEAWSPAEGALVRSLAPERCLVFARWDRLQRSEGRWNPSEADALRERLMRLISLGAEPVLCLYDGNAPGWFADMGGWEREDNLRCYLRYVSRTVRSVGHLCRDYVTFFAPNREALSNPEQGYLRRQLCLSHMACDHIRAYKLIRDLRQERGWPETRVGVILSVKPERSPLRARDRETLPILSFVKGEFRLPERNVLRARPGSWCDFLAVHCPPGAEEAAEKSVSRLTQTPMVFIAEQAGE